MTKTAQRTLVWWGVVVCCAVFLGWSVWTIRHTWESTCGRWRNTVMVTKAMQAPLQHMQQQLNGPSFRFYQFDNEWRVVSRFEDDLHGTKWKRCGGMMFKRRSDRSGFWALTKEKTRPVRCSWSHGVKLTDRPRKPTMRRLLDEGWEMDREYYGATPLDGLITEAVHNPPHYTAERILWSGYVHNTFAVLSTLGILVGTPMALFATRRAHRKKEGCCAECGYSLSGLPGDAPCPECGASPSIREPRLPRPRRDSPRRAPDP